MKVSWWSVVVALALLSGVASALASGPEEYGDDGPAIGHGIPPGAMIIHVQQPSDVLGAAEFQYKGRVFAAVDRHRCGSYELPAENLAYDQGGSRIGDLVVGAPDQPAACRRTGALVTLFRGDGVQLARAFAFLPGTSVALTSAQLSASRSPLPVAGLGGLADPVVNESAPAGPAASQDHRDDGPPSAVQNPSDAMIVQVELPRDGGIPSALPYGRRVFAVVDGYRCRSLVIPRGSLAYDIGPLTIGDLIVGAPDQPSACRRTGAMVLLYRGDGVQLAQTFVFQPGTSVGLASAALSDSPTQLPLTGSGGLAATSESGRSAWASLAIVVALVVLAALVGGGSGRVARRP